MVCCGELVGWAVLTILTVETFYVTFRFIYSVFLGAALKRNLNPLSYGPWAVITGATDGMGKAYALKLGSMGLNVVLISRNENKLQQVAEEIRQKNNIVQVKTIAIDFTESQTIYTKLRADLATVSVGLLINNVGIGNPSSPFIEAHTEDDIKNMINCNIMSMVRLTNIILPHMKKKKKGLIINVGSLLGEGSTPLKTLYGATKAFVHKFSQDLAAECQPDGIIVQTSIPGLVVPASSPIAKTVKAATPEVFVEASLRTWGIESRTAPYWFHKILLFVGGKMHFYFPKFTQRQVMKSLPASSRLG